MNNIYNDSTIPGINKKNNNIYKCNDKNYFNEHYHNDNKIFNIFKTKKKINKNSIKNNKENKIKNKLINNDNKNNEINLKIVNKYSLLPKKVWSLNNKKIDTNNFFDDCTKIWPFDECCFIKEIALEFLMRNNYSTDTCLDKINDFVYFMKKRAKELDFPIISENIKTIKNYNLRKTNFN